MAEITPFGRPPFTPPNYTRSLMRPFSIPLSGMSAQRQRIETIATNLANLDTATTPGAPSFQRQVALLQRGQDGTVQAAGVQQVETGVVREYMPDHPLADEDGFVAFPDISPQDELADLMIARRMFEANATVFEAAKAMVRRAMEI